MSTQYFSHGYRTSSDIGYTRNLVQSHCIPSFFVPDNNSKGGECTGEKDRNGEENAISWKRSWRGTKDFTTNTKNVVSACRVKVETLTAQERRQEVHYKALLAKL